MQVWGSSRTGRDGVWTRGGGAYRWQCCFASHRVRWARDILRESRSRTPNRPGGPSEPARYAPVCTIAIVGWRCQLTGSFGDRVVEWWSIREWRIDGLGFWVFGSRGWPRTRRPIEGVRPMLGVPLRTQVVRSSDLFPRESWGLRGVQELQNNQGRAEGRCRTAASRGGAP